MTEFKYYSAPYHAAAYQAVSNEELSRCATEIDAMIASANYPSIDHNKRNKSDRKRNKANRWR